jgi:hypothetical protein
VSFEQRVSDWRKDKAAKWLTLSNATVLLEVAHDGVAVVTVGRVREGLMTADF